MLSLNDVLRTEGIAPDTVQVVRHHKSGQRTPTLYGVWKSPGGAALVEEYQSVQSKKAFAVGELLASFVVTPRPRNETVFIGLYRVNGMNPARVRLRDPIFGNEFDGFQYDIVSDPRLAEYKDRLVIDWGPAAINWHQQASRNNKRIVSIRDDEGPPFPGFDRFWMDLEEVDGMHRSWEIVLASVKGIYVLTDRDTGKQYVGSAKGADNLLGRLRDYAATGHGGNVELRSRKGARYRVGILEIVDTGLSDFKIEEIEAAWKDKLMTRKPNGLNSN